MALLESKNPATGEVIGSVEITPTAEIEASVQRARSAQPAWEAMGFEGRRAHLLQIGEGLSARFDDLVTLITREQGKPTAEARGEMSVCVGGIGAEVEELQRALEPEVIDDGRTRSTIHRDPFGVCAAISPWNFPILMPHSLVFPALAAGNAVVFKPSEETPLCGQAYFEVLSAHLPAGVLQIVHGADEQGRALVESEVDLIAFTGSREVGKKIHAAASSRLKRVVLELGGKDPMIVLSTADLERAAKTAAQNSFRNAGQVCVSTERIYVDKTVAPQFLDLLAEHTHKLRVGPGTDPGTDVGPMVSERQRDHVLRQIREAVDAGAELVVGGEHDGSFVQPTVLSGVTPEMGIAREETFGPVACVSIVDGDDEAVRLANDTRFGLGAIVFGGEDERTRQVARRLRAGMIGINKTCGGASGTPWVGAGESGYGFHSSTEGHRNFAQVRVISERAKR